ncbi:MAG: histidine kinase dimerization/phosphoacceptor domain -containing protein [bacterium]|nr:histidine kinase dimerization/phosphoacceptor domain -containing protein [bacterium]
MSSSIKNIDPLLDTSQSGHSLTRAIINTIREPLVILDEKLKIIAASKSFYKKFGLDFDVTHGKMFYDLGNGQWNIPALRVLLEEVIPEHKIVNDYEINHDFFKLGQRTMLINAKEISGRANRKKMLISIFDVTDQRKLEHERENLAKQKDILLKEMRHRIANSLQIIASILLLKAESVTSEETRSQLEDVHDRIMSIATVQGHLDPAGLDNNVEVAPYLRALCQSLAASMIGDRKPISIKVCAGPGKVTTDEAIGLGLITTELVINALKHAFTANPTGEVTVGYEAQELNWRLTIGDNGRGMSKIDLTGRKGLGSGIVNTLTKQLNAIVKTESSSTGTIVSIIHE